MIRHKSEVLEFIGKFDGTKESMDYSMMLVAFIDILGIRSLLKDTNKSNLVIGRMSKFVKIVESECTKVNFNKKDIFKWVIMGDGAAIITDSCNFDALCNTVLNIQVQVMLEIGMPLRGAITSGEVTVLYDGQVIIGPAFVEAFELESEVAIYPRVLVSCKAMHEFNNSTNHIFKYLKQDFDSNYVLDFVSAITDKGRESIYIIEKLNEIIASHMNSEPVLKSCKLTQKYGWLHKFVNNNISM